MGLIGSVNRIFGVGFVGLFMLEHLEVLLSGVVSEVATQKLF